MEKRTTNYNEDNPNALNVTKEALVYAKELKKEYTADSGDKSTEPSFLDIKEAFESGAAWHKKQVFPFIDSHQELLEVLNNIYNWEMPNTGKFWADGTPMSYEFCYGSDGVRDYIKSLAKAAIEKCKKLNV